MVMILKGRVVVDRGRLNFSEVYLIRRASALHTLWTAWTFLSRLGYWPR